MLLKNISLVALLVATFCCAMPAMGAPAKKASKTTAAIQNGKTVRTKTDASGLYNQACYDAYYGCMDQFCIPDNSNGGSCACSDESIKFEKELAELQNTLEEAERIKTVEVERIQAGAAADIIFNGERKYDENGNVIRNATAADEKAKKRESLLAMFEQNYDDDDDIFDVVDGIGGKQGAALYTAANELCSDQMPDECTEKDITFIRQLYSRQITSDCKGFENTLAEKRNQSKQEMASAESAVRNAQKEQLAAANKYGLGECMVEFKKCMLTADACGADWENCVSSTGAAQMQNSKVATSQTYNISVATLDILDAKRPICERVLDQCLAVRDQVWTSFLREAAPSIKLAESQAESKFRTSCLTTISDCLHRACKDDIVGKGTATMDACLARPEMARNFCKVEIDPCEKMEPNIFAYVKDKLAGMRVDACTQEVKDCFTDENRCGSDFSNCVGMDLEFIHDMCPIDKLVVCKQGNPNFSMDDLDTMLSGLYMNVDNAALENCENLVQKKMLEICGSTTDCSNIAGFETIGTKSLRSQKDGKTYRITGLMGLDNILFTKDPGKVDVEDYLEKIQEFNANIDFKGKDTVLKEIEQELRSINTAVDRTISMFESEPKIQYCVSGREMKQITGKKGKSEARFPHLLDSAKQTIVTGILNQAKRNYETKFATMQAELTKNASADVAQITCQMMPFTNGANGQTTGTTVSDDPASYAIMWETPGVDDESLKAAIGKYSATLAGASLDTKDGNTNYKGKAVADSVKYMNDGAAAVVSLGATAITQSVTEGIKALSGTDKVRIETPGGTREMWALFNRDTRVCHYCTVTISQECESENKKGFLGIGQKNSQKCGEARTEEKCEDIQM